MPASQPGDEPAFVPGAVYRLTRTFTAMRDWFNAGEVVAFERKAYSVYDGIAGWFFLDSRGRGRRWDVTDDPKMRVGVEEDPALWDTLFERLDVDDARLDAVRAGDVRLLGRLVARNQASAPETALLALPVLLSHDDAELTRIVIEWIQPDPRLVRWLSTAATDAGAENVLTGLRRAVVD